MTIQDLKTKNLLLFESISGSRLAQSRETLRSGATFSFLQRKDQSAGK